MQGELRIAELQRCGKGTPAQPPRPPSPPAQGGGGVPAKQAELQ